MASFFFEKIVGAWALTGFPCPARCCVRSCQSYGKLSGPYSGGAPKFWSRSIKTRLRCRGTSSSGATITVRPDCRRMINRPSEVIPTTRLRTERVRPRGELSELSSAPARLDADATDFFLLCELDSLAVVEGGSKFACADPFAFAAASAETELSRVAAAVFAAVSVGGGAGDWAFAI